MGESKSEVLQLVPDHLKPKTRLIKLPATTDEVVTLLQQENFSLPVIFKPDLGERGWMVRRINDVEDIARYLREIKIDFIVQELVDLPLEFGVFYVRFPSEPAGRVNSITAKEFLTITGDGRQTWEQLILDSPRARLQWEKLRSVYADRLGEVLALGERKELVSIGNHCLGTKFINGNHLITPALNQTFNQIAQQIPGFFFGRFDLRCASLADLEAGRVKILELNGCGAEPAHIYHPGASLREAMKVLFTHWHNLYRISKENHQRGTPYLSLREGWKIYRQFSSLTKE